MFTISLPCFSFRQNPTYIIPSITLFLFEPCLNKNICVFNPPLTLVSSHHSTTPPEGSKLCQCITLHFVIELKVKNSRYLESNLWRKKKLFVFTSIFFHPCREARHPFWLICHAISEIGLGKEPEHRLSRCLLGHGGRTSHRCPV